ncbi:MAG: methyltransferase domain-containing protein [Actinomycetota bacterium]
MPDDEDLLGSEDSTASLPGEDLPGSEDIAASVRNEAHRGRSEGRYPADLDEHVDALYERAFSPPPLIPLRDDWREMISSLRDKASFPLRVQPPSEGSRLVTNLGYRAASWYVRGAVDEVEHFAKGAVDVIEQLSVQIERLHARVYEFEVRSVEAEQHLARAQERLERLHAVERVSNIERQLRSLRERLAASPSTPEAPVETEEQGDQTGLDYLLFHSFFDAPKAALERRDRYLAELRGLRDVVDLGCGTGEVLDAMVRAGVDARGVDSSSDIVLACRERGLPVVEADALEYLVNAPDASLGAILALQLVEHLPPKRMVHLVREAERALRPGGVLIAETVNIENLSVFARTFYIDLTHVTPVHPVALSLLCQAAGFPDVQVRYYAPTPAERSLEELPEPSSADLRPLVEAANRNVRKLNELLAGYQDYAVIARKAE